MPSRRSLQLVLLAVLLVGMSAYLSIGVLGLGGRGAGLAYPGDPDVVVPAEPITAAVAPAATGVTTVEILPRARLLALPAGPTPQLCTPTGEVVAARAAWLAGSLAVPLGRDRARGRQLVRFELEHGEAVFVIVQVGEGDRTIQVTLGAAASYSGQVVGADRQGLGGARVWLAGHEVVSDARGEFRVEGLRVHAGLPLVIRAPGYADHFRIVDVDPGLPPAQFCLEPGMTLTVQSTAVVAGDGRARVVLLPAPDTGDGDSRLRHYPFFWPAVDAGFGGLDRDGMGRIEGLPRGARLAVVVQHPLAVAAAPLPVDLQGTQASVIVPSPTQPVVVGTVYGGAGRALPATLVVCAPGTVSGRGLATGPLLTPGALLAGTALALTSADGSFALAQPSGRGDHLAVLPDHGAGVELRVERKGDLHGIALHLPVVEALVPGRTGLRLTASSPQRVRVVRGQSRDLTVDVDQDTPLTLELREPMVVDITVHGAQGVRRLVGLAVDGIVDVAL